MSYAMNQESINTFKMHFEIQLYSLSWCVSLCPDPHGIYVHFHRVGLSVVCNVLHLPFACFWIEYFTSIGLHTNISVWFNTFDQRQI